MAKLPDYSDLGQNPVPQLPRRSGEVATYHAVTGIEDAAAKFQQRAGEQLQQGAVIALHAVEDYDKTRAEDSLNALREKQVDLTTGDDGFMRKKGGDAVNQPLLKDYGDRFDKAAADIGATLGSEYQRKLFTQRAATFRLELSENIVKHVAQQDDVYQKNVLDGTLETESRVAAAGGMVPVSLARMNAAVDRYARRSGSSEPEIAALKLRAADSLWTAKIRATAYTDPLQAQALYREHEAEIGPANKIIVEHEIKTNARPVEAKNIADLVRAEAPPSGSRDTRAMLGPWMARAEQQAEALHPNDPGFRDMVTSQVKGYVANVIAAQEGEQKQAQGVLLANLFGQDGKPRPVTMDELLNRPGSREAFTKVDPGALHGIAALLEHNQREASGEFIRGNAGVVKELHDRMFLDESDPNKIRSVTELVPYFAKGINAHQYDWLKRELETARTPEGNAFLRDRNRFVNRARQRMGEGIMGQTLRAADPATFNDALFNFELAVDKQIDEARKGGKDARKLLFDPQSPDYIMRPGYVESFMPNGREAVRDAANKVRRAGESPEAPPSAYNAQTKEWAVLKDGKWETRPDIPPRESMTVLDAAAPNTTYEKLAAGAWFIGPDGGVRQKPQPAAAASEASLKIPTLKVGVADERPGMSKYADQRKGLEERRAAAETENFDANVRTAESAIAAYEFQKNVVKTVVSAGPEFGRAIGRSLPTDLEKSVENFRSLVKTGTYRPGSASLISDALATGALTRQEERVAKAMLQQIADTKR